PSQSEAPHRRGQPAQQTSPEPSKRGILTLNLKSDSWLLLLLWKKVTRPKSWRSRRAERLGPVEATNAASGASARTTRQLPRPCARRYTAGASLTCMSTSIRIPEMRAAEPIDVAAGDVARLAEFIDSNDRLLVLTGAGISTH